MSDTIAVIVAGVLFLVAALHVAWALGMTWPGHDEASLNAYVVGGKPGSAMPPRMLTVAVALAVSGIALGALAARGLVTLPLPAVVRALTWVAAGVLALRGLGGFFDAQLRPHVRALPYATWNRRLYSPLCLGLAAGLVIALTT